MTGSLVGARGAGLAGVASGFDSGDGDGLGGNTSFGGGGGGGSGGGCLGTCNKTTCKSCGVILPTSNLGTNHSILKCASTEKNIAQYSEREFE